MADRRGWIAATIRTGCRVNAVGFLGRSFENCAKFRPNVPLFGRHGAMRHRRASGTGGRLAIPRKPSANSSTQRRGSRDGACSGTVVRARRRSSTASSSASSAPGRGEGVSVVFIRAFYLCCDAQESCPDAGLCSLKKSDICPNACLSTRNVWRKMAF